MKWWSMTEVINHLNEEFWNNICLYKTGIKLADDWKYQLELNGSFPQEREIQAGIPLGQY